jgi:MSHA biogenesis protein MshO
MRPSRSRGFTLVEMVISITLISLLALVAAPMLRLPLTAWLDTTRRAEMTNSLEQMNAKLGDDLRRALPNSVRVRTIGGRVLLEMLEVRAWGRHRAGPSGGAQVCPASACGAPGAQDVLNAACSETCFTSLGTLEGDVPVAGSDWVVVNPLGPGVPAGDPYFGGNAAVANGIKTRLTALAPAPDGNRLQIAAHTFPALAASRRFYLVATPVTWDCNPATQQLTRRWNYPVSALQPIAFPAAAGVAPMATRIGACTIRYQAAGSQGRGGLVHLALRVSVPAADTQVPETAQWSATFAVSEGP